MFSLLANLFVYSFFVFSGKFITLISRFATPISNFHAFSLKIGFYWLPDFNNLRARLFPDHQFSLYFLMKNVTTRLQQSVIFNLIATYNKHFIIILKIHMFFLQLFCFDLKIIKPFPFFFYSNILLKYLYIATLLLIFIIFVNVIS